MNTAMARMFTPSQHAVLESAVTELAGTIVFATVSGAHLYGFPSPDSDVDIRCVHALPPRRLLGLRQPRETVERSEMIEGWEVDLVSHELAKFARMLLKPNGYVLEQLTSPLVIATSPLHEALLRYVPRLLTKGHAHHYQGFARNQWQRVCADSPPRIKPMLYAFRVLLTGIHLMRSGRIEANLPVLNEMFRFDFLTELIQQKREEGERCRVRETEFSRFEREFEVVATSLASVQADSALPDQSDAAEDLERLIVDIRLGGIAAP